MRTRPAPQHALDPPHGCLGSGGHQRGRGRPRAAGRPPPAPAGGRASVCPAWPSGFFVAGGRGGGARREGARSPARNRLGDPLDIPGGSPGRTPRPSNPTAASPSLRDSFSFPFSSLGEGWDFRFHRRGTSGKSCCTENRTAHRSVGASERKKGTRRGLHGARPEVLLFGL